MEELKGNTDGALDMPVLPSTSHDSLSGLKIKQSPTMVCSIDEHPLFVRDNVVDKGEIYKMRDNEILNPSLPSMSHPGGISVFVDHGLDATETDNALTDIPHVLKSKIASHCLESSIEKLSETKTKELKTFKSNSKEVESLDCAEVNGTKVAMTNQPDSITCGDVAKQRNSMNTVEVSNALQSDNCIEIRHREPTTSYGKAGVSSEPINTTTFPINTTATTMTTPIKAALTSDSTPMGVATRQSIRKGKTTPQNSDSARKLNGASYFSRSKSEAVGTNNLVFSYRKDADEVEIHEVPSEDSISSSDVEAENLDRMPDDQDIQIDDELHAAQTGEEHTKPGLRLTQSATNFVSNQQPIPIQKYHHAAKGNLIKRPNRKKQPWASWVLNPNYKFRHDEFKRIFRNIPRNDRLVVDYSCALQKHILIQGRLYISQNWICFYANIFGVETTVSISFKDVIQITKEKTALVFPNAVQICTADEKHFFSSLNARDKTYLILSYFWKNALSDQPMSHEELWSWIHYSYGDDLGISLQDQDYVPLSPEEKAKQMAKIEHEATMNLDLEGLGTSMTSKDLLDEDELVPDAEAVIAKQDFVKKGKPASSLSSQIQSPTEEIQCSGHEHFPIFVCNEIFNFPVDILFQHCFSDSKIFRSFIVAKRTTDVDLSSWPETPTANGEYVRNISYVLSLNLPLTSKKAPTNEKQRMYPSSKQGCLYVIDTECQSPTIPYGDSFYVVNRYCLTRVSLLTSRLHITSQVIYLKSVFFKSFIDKNAAAGIADSFKVLVSLLRAQSLGKEEDIEEVHSGSDALNNDQLPLNSIVDKSQLQKMLTGNIRPILSIFTVIMMVVMAFMIYKVWYTAIPTVDTCTANLYTQENNKLSDMDQSWKEKIQSQLLQQQTEIDKWKSEVLNMIETIDEFKEMLNGLLQRLNQHL